MLKILVEIIMSVVVANFKANEYIFLTKQYCENSEDNVIEINRKLLNKWFVSYI